MGKVSGGAGRSTGAAGGGGATGRNAPRESGYTVQPARYAKNSVAISVENNGTFANRAQMLAQAVGGSYRGRERAIVMTNSAFRRFERLYREGYSGSVLGGLITPGGEFLPRGTRR